jgi:thiol-disulfide isomerase/thioredoxin
MNARPLLALSLLIPILAGCATDPPARLLTPEERATPATLTIGDPAPPLAIQRWVKGDPVTSFQPGMVYVLDFWASWCEPCRASMPGLSRLQDQYQGRLIAIGVTRLEERNGEGAISQAVQSRQDAIRFRIAIDDAGQTTDRYWVAVRESAIPRSFIIDKQGRFAWFGHPCDLAPVLRAVLDGTWDLAAARAEQLRRDNIAIRSRAIVEDYIQAGRRNDVQAKLRAAERAVQFPIKDMQGMCPNYWAWTTRVECLIALGRTDEAKSAAAAASATPGLADDAYGMAQLALLVKTVAPDDASRYADQALRLVHEAESHQPATEWETFLAEADTLQHAAARVFIADVRASEGRMEEAGTLLRAAISNWPDSDHMVPNKTELNRRLAEYESRQPSP